MNAAREVVTELAELRKLGTLAAVDYAKACRYIELNESEVEGYVDTMDVSQAADLVVALARACAGGRCE